MNSACMTQSYTMMPQRGTMEESGAHLRGQHHSQLNNDLTRLPVGNGAGISDHPLGSHLEAQPHQGTERQAPSLQRPHLQVHRLSPQRFTYDSSPLRPRLDGFRHSFTNRLCSTRSAASRTASSNPSGSRSGRSLNTCRQSVAIRSQVNRRALGTCPRLLPTLASTRLAPR